MALNLAHQILDRFAHSNNQAAAFFRRCIGAGLVHRHFRVRNLRFQFGGPRVLQFGLENAAGHQSIHLKKGFVRVLCIETAIVIPEPCGLAVPIGCGLALAHACELN